MSYIKDEQHKKESIAMDAMFSAKDCALYSAAGIVLGVMIEMLIRAFQSKSPTKDTAMTKMKYLGIQLAFCIVVLFVIERFISKKFAEAWQSVTPGLFFVTFFFSSQASLFSNIPIPVIDIGEPERPRKTCAKK